MGLPFKEHLDRKVIIFAFSFQQTRNQSIHSRYISVKRVTKKEASDDHVQITRFEFHPHLAHQFDLVPSYSSRIFSAYFYRYLKPIPFSGCKFLVLYYCILVFSLSLSLFHGYLMPLNFPYAHGVMQPSSPISLFQFRHPSVSIPASALSLSLFTFTRHFHKTWMRFDTSLSVIVAQD